MEYRGLGRAGLKISRIVFGCGGIGVAPGAAPGWRIAGEAARPLIRAALEAGVTCFDTANHAGAGESETVLGEAVKAFARRDDVVIMTKVGAPVGQGPSGRGLSRKAVMTQIDQSLRRLGTDYIDVYQVHRWDPETPLEETLEALDDVVRSGKALYVGASSMFAWQFCLALQVARAAGWAKFVSMQNHLNLAYREEEREMVPLCGAERIGLLPWSPLAAGRLARPWACRSVSQRSQLDKRSAALFDPVAELDQPVVDSLEAVARRLALPQSQVALAWLLQKPEVVAPIVGIMHPSHLHNAVAAVSVRLDEETIRELEQPYRPHPPAGID